MIKNTSATQDKIHQLITQKLEIPRINQSRIECHNPIRHP